MKRVKFIVVTYLRAQGGCTAAPGICTGKNGYTMRPQVSAQGKYTGCARWIFVARSHPFLLSVADVSDADDVTFLNPAVPSRQRKRKRKRPDTTSENEKGQVRCRHIPTCTRWVYRRTRNRHWQELLRDQAQGKCPRQVHGMCEVDICSSFTLFLFVSCGCERWR